MMRQEFVQEDNNVAEILAIKSYTEIFSHNFYLVGVMSSITNKACEINNMDENISSEEFIKRIDEDPIDVNIISGIVEDKYKEALSDSNVCLSICFIISQVEMYLSNLKTIGYSKIDYNNYGIIYQILMDSGKRETIIRGRVWYQQHSTKRATYWGYNIVVDSNSFKKRYKNDILVGGEYEINPNTNVESKELYVCQMKNNIDYLKFLYNKENKEVNISWHLSDIFEGYGDLVCDGIYYNNGGIVCRTILEEEERLEDNTVKIRSITKVLAYRENFIRLIKENFKKISEYKYGSMTPWGIVVTDVRNIIDTNKNAKYFVGKLKNEEE